jgi:hypothetical protein
MPIVTRTNFSPGENDFSRMPLHSSQWVTFVGQSMHPTLREPEMLEVLPCREQPIRRGDVVFFPGEAPANLLVHRVIAIRPEGIVTRGDNCRRADVFITPHHAVIGRVEASWRGNRRRKVTGGYPGLIRHYVLRLVRLLRNAAVPCCGSLYRTLAAKGWVARCLPAMLRPKVVRFEKRGETVLRILFRGKVIGRYDNRLRRWVIRRPFRLLVNETAVADPDNNM